MAKLSVKNIINKKWRKILIVLVGSFENGIEGKL